MVKLLTHGIGLDFDEDVERVDGFVDIPDLMQLYCSRPAKVEGQADIAVVPAPNCRKRIIYLT